MSGSARIGLSLTASTALTLNIFTDRYLTGFKHDTQSTNSEVRSLTLFAENDSVFSKTLLYTGHKNI